ncbi:ankyrin, partial [Aspergillus ellipticus CBS 707.79]
TPLSVAVKHGYLETVRLLLQEKANINRKSEYNGSTPLLMAVQEGRIKVMNLLLENSDIDVDVNLIGGLDNETPLNLAVRQSPKYVTVCLLTHDRVNVNSRDLYNRTPLHQAARHGVLLLVKLLLKHKEVNVNLTDDRSGTLLYSAICQDDTTIVKLLLEDQRVIMDTETLEERSTLEAATCQGAGILELFLSKAKSGVDSRSHKSSALLWAAKHGKEATTCICIEEGADVETTDNQGMIPFSLAAQQGHMNVLKSL